MANNNVKNTAPATENVKNTQETVISEKNVTFPSQQTGETSDAKSAAVLTIGDALKAVEEKRSEGMTIALTLDENGEIQIQVDEIQKDGKAKKLVAGAKGVFQRNKKLVIASAGLMAASVVLKVISNRQAALEADEVVESSDEINPDA